MLFADDSELLIAAYYCVESHDIGAQSATICAGSCSDSTPVLSGNRRSVRFSGASALVKKDTTIYIAATSSNMKYILSLNRTTGLVSPFTSVTHYVYDMILDESRNRLLLSVGSGLAAVQLGNKQYTLVSQSADSGRATGALPEMLLSHPRGLVFMNESTLLVADTFNNR